MTDPQLSKYNPLERIITFDQFNKGHCGWLDLRPNFVKPNFAAHSNEIDLIHWGPSMLSSATFPLMGTHGALSGTWSLKLATRANSAPANQPPAPGSMGLAIKRMAVPGALHLLQIETWFTYTPEPSVMGLGDKDVRAFGCFVDLQSQGNRWMPGVRYVNSIDGEHVKRWQYFRVNEGVDSKRWNYGVDGWHKVGVDGQWYGQRESDGSSDGFQWIDDGQQNLVANEADDKVNWMYMRLTIDVSRREYVELQCMDKIMDLRGKQPTLAPEYKGITGLLNPVFFVETGANRRVFLFLDSVVISTDAYLNNNK